MQTIMVTGNAGGPGDFRFSPNGKPVLRFSVADNVKRADGTDGPTTWFDVQAWGPLAELYADKIAKGSYVTVAGRVELNEWTKDVEENGETVTKHFAKLRINAQAIGIAEPRDSATQGGGSGQGGQRPTPAANAQQAATTGRSGGIPGRDLPAADDEDPFGDQ